MKTAPEKQQKRRTQAERSDSMRKRLLKATLESLAENGYTGSTLSSIVRRAGVSRGAQVHHYPSKTALILDAAQHLMRRAYRILGEVLLGIANEDNRLQALLDATWEEIFSTRMFNAYFELVIASQHDKELAAALRKLARNTRMTLEAPIKHYFEPHSESSADTQDMFTLTVLMLGGMAATSHLADNPGELRRHLQLWVRLMTEHMRARKGVSAPPPRPSSWEPSPL